MNEKPGEPHHFEPPDDAVPDVTQIPLIDLEGRVLGAAIRRLVEDANDGREVTAQFGNAP